MCETDAKTFRTAKLIMMTYRLTLRRVLLEVTDTIKIEFANTHNRNNIAKNEITTATVFTSYSTLGVVLGTSWVKLSSDIGTSMNLLLLSLMIRRSCGAQTCGTVGGSLQTDEINMVKAYLCVSVACRQHHCGQFQSHFSIYLTHIYFFLLFLHSSGESFLIL